MKNSLNIDRTKNRSWIHYKNIDIPKGLFYLNRYNKIFLIVYRTCCRRLYFFLVPLFFSCGKNVWNRSSGKWPVMRSSPIHQTCVILVLWKNPHNRQLTFHRITLNRSACNWKIMASLIMVSAALLHFLITSHSVLSLLLTQWLESKCS